MMMGQGLGKNSLNSERSHLELEEVIFWLRVCPEGKTERKLLLAQFSSNSWAV